MAVIPPGLRLDQAPPISVPFRFFLTAPLFLLAAAAVLMWRGPEVFESRLSPAALAVTHLFTLGFMTMVMSGAIMQVLPVLAGAPVPMPRLTGTIVHAGLTLGTLLLAAGFLASEPGLLKAAVVLLGLTFVVFVSSAGVALSRVAIAHVTLRSIWLAVGGLAVTAGIGIALAAGLAWGFAPADASLRILHPGWGLFGWTGLLAIGVAYQVVPMFQITPPYPETLSRWLSAAIFALLLVWSLGAWAGAGETPAAIALGLVVGAYAAFAVVTLLLQQRRRRRIPDVTTAFWRVGMVCLLLGALLWAAQGLLRLELPDSAQLLLGVMALPGFAGSIISGMLYKIVPFLAWFHLQAQTGAGRIAPNMKRILPDPPQQVHFRIHLIALALLAGCAFAPALLPYGAALAVAIEALLLARNLMLAVRGYREFLSAAAAGAAR